MLAVDTNVLVRLAVDDDAGQTARARAALAGRRFFVSTTVLLETEWVLRRLYRLDRPALLRTLRAIAGQESSVLENADRVRTALDDFERGLDFADALHLRATPDGATFLTFDRALAAASDGVPVREP